MKVTVYTIPNCPFCKQEKDYLTSKGVNFEEKDVQSSKENLTEMLNVSNKFAGVPFTVIEKDGGEKVMLKGFTQSEFDDALGSGTDTAKPTPATEGDMPKPVAPKAPEPVKPVVPTEMPKPAAPVTSAPMGGSIPPVSADKPAMNDAIKSPMAGNMDSTPASVTPPVGGNMPMPSAPVASVGTPSPAKPDDVNDPQKELSGLLKDLESKTGVSSTPPTGEEMPKPAAPVTNAPMGGSTPPVAAPTVPDFNKQS